MQPVKEDNSMTPSESNKKLIKQTYTIVSNLNDEELMKFKPDVFIQYKKRRNKMKHLTPKKKKRKK
jgi:hypothetical protein